MRTEVPNPGLILRSIAKRCVSKDGDAAHASRRALRALLSMRSGKCCTHRAMRERDLAGTYRYF